MSNQDVVMIAKPKCLTCKKLFSENEKSFNCADDPNCPAQTYKIVIGVNVLDYSERLGQAMKENNVLEIAQIMQDLSKVDEEVKNKVLAFAKQKL